MSIVAAGQPDLRDRVRFVNSFGSYDDARSLLVDVASRSIEVDGQVRAVAARSSARVEVVAMRWPTPRVDQARDRAEVERRTSRRARAEADRRGLPAGSRSSSCARISPSTYLAQLHAHLYLMHDVDDTFIPFTQSRDLVGQRAARRGRSATPSFRSSPT